MKIFRWLFVLLGLAGLVAVRMFEDWLFYDPFLNYFHEASKETVFPEFAWGQLIFSCIFRFLLNLLFSGIIIYSLFLNKIWTLQAALLMVMVFCITFPIYLFCIADKFETGYLFSFYMRRFVIQPIAVLLIIPLFYYRKSLLASTNNT